MVYPLAEQRLHAQAQANRHEEAVVLELDAFAGLILEAHKGLGRATGNAVDLATLTPLLRDMAGGKTLLKELGWKGAYYVKAAKGRTYVVFKGYAALRESLKGTRYLASSPKVIAFGIGPEALRSAARSNAIIMVVCYVTLDVMEFIMSDEQLYSTLFANIIVDVSIGAVAIGAGLLLGKALAGIATVAVASVGLPIVVGLAVGAGLALLADAFDLKQKLGAALHWTAEAVTRGLQAAGQVVQEAQVALRQKVEEVEREIGRKAYQFEKELIWHFAPQAYPYLYRN